MAKVGDTIEVDGETWTAGADGNWHPSIAGGAGLPGTLGAGPAAVAGVKNAFTPKAPGGAPSSFLDQVKLGASRAPGGLMQIVAGGMNKIENNPVLSMGMNPGPFARLGIDTQALVDAPWDEASAEAHRRVFGTDPATPRTDVLGKTGQNFGASLATPMPGAPGGGTLPGMAMEGAGSFLGSLADPVLEWMGVENKPAQTVAAMGASLTPAMAGRTLARRAASAKVRQEAQKAAQGVALRQNPATSFMPANPSPATMARAASEFKATIPQGFEEQAAQRLDDTLAQFSDPKTRPTTSQALDELGGEAAESAAMSLSRDDRTAGRNLAGQKLRAVQAIDDEIAAARPKGSFDEAQAAYDDVTEKAATRERKAWERVPLDKMPRVPTGGLAQAVDEITASVGKAGAGDIPPIFGVVKSYEGWEPFSELQALRSKLLRLERAGRSNAATESAMAQGALAGRLRQHVEKLIDDVAENNQVTGAPLEPGTAATNLREEGVDALRTAHRITRENREIFNGQSKLVKALDDPKEARDLASALLRGGPQDARRALSMFKSRPKAQDSVRAVVMDDLLGKDILNPGGAKGALERIRTKRRTVVALFGPEHVQNVERILRKAQTVKSGRAGTRAGALGTGSNTLSAQAVTALESGMKRIGQRGLVKSAVDLAKQQTIGRVRAAFETEFARVMAAAAIDPELARDLLRIPGPAAVPQWASRMEGHMARNGIRIVAQSAQDIGAQEQP